MVITAPIHIVRCICTRKGNFPPRSRTVRRLVCVQSSWVPHGSSRAHESCFLREFPSSFLVQTRTGSITQDTWMHRPFANWLPFLSIHIKDTELLGRGEYTYIPSKFPQSNLKTVFNFEQIDFKSKCEWP